MSVKKFLSELKKFFIDSFLDPVYQDDLPPINHLQSVRIKLLTIGEIHEGPKTAVHLGI